MRVSGFVPIAAFALLAGCTTTPGFKGENLAAPAPGTQRTAEAIPTVSDIVRHVQCEIYDELKRNPDFRDGSYVVVATLTLEVTDNGSFNPTMAFTKKFSTADTGRNIGTGFQINGTSHRTFQQSFTLNLQTTAAGEPTNDAAQPEVCTQEQNGKRPGLRGNLGIGNTIAEGVNKNKFIFEVIENKAKAGEFEPDLPTFGTTVDFTLVQGVGVNPVWTLEDVVFPGGGDSPFLNYNQTTKDTLALTFASAKTSIVRRPQAALDAMAPKDREAILSAEKAEIAAATPAANAAAARAARLAATNAILLRILPNR
jgi:hypothetical protein